MHESELNMMLVNGFRRLGWHAHKIYDGSSFGRKCEQPYDSFTFTDGFPVAIEGKAIRPTGKKKQYTSFRFDNIEPHQIDQLQGADIAGGGFIALYAYTPYKLCRVTFVHIADICARLEAGQRNITAEELEEFTWYDRLKDAFIFPQDLAESFRIMARGATEAGGPNED